MYNPKLTINQDYLYKLSFYNIKVNACDIDVITGLNFVDAIQRWEAKLRCALKLGVNWVIGNYDPNALDQEIDAKYRIKATEYGIQFDEEDWCANAYGHIIDVVNDWEALVARARSEHDIDWDITDYNYAELEKLISNEDNYQTNKIDYYR